MEEGHNMPDSAHRFFVYLVYNVFLLDECRNEISNVTGKHRGYDAGVRAK